MNARFYRYGRRAGILLMAVALSWTGLRMLRRRLLPVPEDRCTSHRFDGAVWRDTTQVYSVAAPRGCMVDGLLRQHQFVGWSRAAVVHLLGEPQPTQYFREYDLVYWLGPQRGPMGIDSEWLVFRLDHAGRVSAYRLVTD